MDFNSDIAISKIRQNIINKLHLVGAFIESAAQNYVPVDTGFLRQTITHEVNNAELTVRIGSNTEYAEYVEFGTGEYSSNGQGRKGGWAYEDPKTGKLIFTRGMRPQPFLRPALALNKDQIRRFLVE